MNNWFRETEKLIHENGADSFFDLRYFACVDSTNEVVKREAARGAAEGLTVIGEEQTAGKGRRGRSWKSPAGESLYFSFLLKPSLPPQHISLLTLVMGLSVAQAVRELYQLDAVIKWPNDIVIGQKKICGILTEAIVPTAIAPAAGDPARHEAGGNAAPSGAAAGDHTNQDCVSCTAHAGPAVHDPARIGIVIGTGINVNNEAFPEELQDRATSLRLELGQEASRSAVLAQTLSCFRKNYEICLKTGDLAGLQVAYNALLVSMNREVRIEDPRGPYTAVSRGIDAGGRLLVERKMTTETGTTVIPEAISSGEVSVRGLYGYV